MKVKKIIFLYIKSIVICFLLLHFYFEFDKEFLKYIIFKEAKDKFFKQRGSNLVYKSGLMLRSASYFYDLADFFRKDDNKKNIIRSYELRTITPHPQSPEGIFYPKSYFFLYPEILKNSFILCSVYFLIVFFLKRLQIRIFYIIIFHIIILIRVLYDHYYLIKELIKYGNLNCFLDIMLLFPYNIILFLALYFFVFSKFEIENNIK